MLSMLFYKCFRVQGIFYLIFIHNMLLIFISYSKRVIRWLVLMFINVIPWYDSLFVNFLTCVQVQKVLRCKLSVRHSLKSDSGSVIVWKVCTWHGLGFSAQIEPVINRLLRNHLQPFEHIAFSNANGMLQDDVLPNCRAQRVVWRTFWTIPAPTWIASHESLGAHRGYDRRNHPCPSFGTCHKNNAQLWGIAIDAASLNVYSGDWLSPCRENSS